MQLRFPTGWDEDHQHCFCTLAGNMPACCHCGMAMPNPYDRTEYVVMWERIAHEKREIERKEVK